ncbi:formyltransferase family protein [Algoriphagus sp.]|uniref:methionyl-tRNA formyltransferase n=1 Tax=Algoriphagus sp. TaxID=1872435 RepID=UPI0032924EE4
MISVFSLGFKGYNALTQLNPAYIPLIDSVVIGRDAGVENDYADELKAWCTSRTIEHFEKEAADQNLPHSNYILLIGWRWLVKESPDQHFIVLHDSLLPKYRGFNPLVTALIEGDSEIGGTAIFAKGAYDTGNIIVQKKVSLVYPCKIQQAIDLMAKIYLEIVTELFEKISTGQTLTSRNQDEKEATYSLWRDQEDYRINWAQPASRVLRHIHASGSPYKGAFSEAGGFRYRILDAALAEDVEIANRTVGKVIFTRNGNPVIVCQEGLLELTAIVAENGEKVALPNFRVRLS